jgi:hypothetical protein
MQRELTDGPVGSVHADRHLPASHSSAFVDSIACPKNRWGSMPTDASGAVTRCVAPTGYPDASGG